MKRDFLDVVQGLAIFLLISAIAGFSIFFGIFPGDIEGWLSSSGDPRLALIYFSLILGSLSMILARMGVEAGALNVVKAESIRGYLTGLPLWMFFILLAFLFLGFWNVSPTCRAPEAVQFQILGSETSYQPLQVMEVSPNQSMTILAVSPDENSRFSCISWEFVGPAFPTLGEKNGCQVTVIFGDQPGPSFISLLATQNFCNNAALFSLEVQVK